MTTIESGVVRCNLSIPPDVLAGARAHAESLYAVSLSFYALSAHSLQRRLDELGRVGKPWYFYAGGEFNDLTHMATAAYYNPYEPNVPFEFQVPGDTHEDIVDTSNLRGLRVSEHITDALGLLNCIVELNGATPLPIRQLEQESVLLNVNILPFDIENYSV